MAMFNTLHFWLVLMNDLLTVGAIVRHPKMPGWGDGQVQSVIGDRITVNFENAGKQVIDGREISLDLVAF